MGICGLGTMLSVRGKQNYIRCSRLVREMGINKIITKTYVSAIVTIIFKRGNEVLWCG